MKYSMNAQYSLGALFFVLGIATLVIMDTKIPAIILIVLAAGLFLQAQMSERKP